MTLKIALNTFRVILSVLMLNEIKGQEVTTLPTTPEGGNYIPVGMCINQKDPDTGRSLSEIHPSEIKDDFCKCERNVVSCDFSKFKSKNLASAELRAYFPKDTVNRICICNSPKNLQVILAEQFIKTYYNVARVDIFNMDGPVIIDGAFGTFFAGDMYMSKVKLLRTMFEWEYGRGRDHDRGNTQFKQDPTLLKCCSEIKTPKFTAPTFYMEETTVNSMNPSALNNQHLWNNILFNDVTFNNMASYSIVLNGQEENASFTNCHFHNMNRTAIAANDFANLVLAHNTFHSTCDDTPVGARSMGSTSVLAVIQNRFDVPITLEVDAQEIAIWFNSFTTWNSETFIHLNETVHGDRTVSIEFNTVDRFDLKPNDIRPFQLYDNKIIFKENLIFPCDCSVFSKINLPAIFQNYTQRCHSESGGRKEACHLSMKEVVDECRKTAGQPNYGSLCGKNENNFRSFVYSKTIKEVESFLKSVSTPIKSPFINEMLQHVKSPFQPMKSRKEVNEKSGQGIAGFHIVLILGFALFLAK